VIEKVGPIKNPLTIIAIFAAIAEISGTVVLPFIDKSNQAVYVWFLMIFPILLILLFFLTLNLNHKVLYAPSDYQNEDNFLHSLPRASFAEKVQKIEAEIADEVALPTTPEPVEKVIEKPESGDIATATESEISYQKLVRRSAQASYMLAEELIFRKLSPEYSSQIQREVKLGTLGGKYIFDGIVRDKGVTTVIEVKFLRSGLAPSMYFRNTFHKIQESVKLLPAEQTANLRVLLAVATDEGSTRQERIAAQIDRFRGEFPFPIEVRFYSLTDLEREFKTEA
jgi:hypothetical protein